MFFWRETSEELWKYLSSKSSHFCLEDLRYYIYIYILLENTISVFLLSISLWNCFHKDATSISNALTLYNHMCISVLFVNALGNFWVKMIYHHCFQCIWNLYFSSVIQECIWITVNHRALRFMHEDDVIIQSISNTSYRSWSDLLRVSWEALL